MLEDNIKDKVHARVIELLNDREIKNYKNHESFYSKTNQSYQFLIWKLKPLHWEEFNNEIQALVENQGYICIPGVWDISTYHSNTQKGYKVIALYKP